MESGKLGFFIALVGRGGKSRCSGSTPGTSKVTTVSMAGRFSTLSHD